MCGVAAGACGGAIELYWADKGSDISDINAKFRAQVRCCNMPRFYSAFAAHFFHRYADIFSFCFRRNIFV